MRFFRSVAALAAISCCTASAGAPATVRPERQRNADALVNVIVTMKEPRPAELTDMKAIRRKLRKQQVACDAEAPDHVAVLVDGLVAHATESHAPVLQWIEAQVPVNTTTTTVQSLWISNEISVRQASPELVEQLRARPDVASVRIEQVARVPTTHANISAVTTATTAIATDNAWSLERVQAPATWAQGFNGTGMRVALIDTGVMATHVSLDGRMVPEYGWYDAVENAATPLDPQSHGTSVLSILTGGNGLGVAPAASWLACRACDEYGECDESWLTACAEFLMCPFKSDGTKDCSKRPHVINMSWNYAYQEETGLQSVVDAWLAAGIMPVFSNGNDGPSCRSVTSPADWTTALTVGATNSADDISAVSARGPGPKGEIKPDITAPGADVVAAGISSTMSVVKILGTSAAAPYVAGAVALLLQAAPTLTPAAVKTLLTGNTDQQSLVPHLKDACVTPTPTAMVFPNNVYGHGRLNVLKAVTSALASSTATRT